jgi:hypothetical protein
MCGKENNMKNLLVPLGPLLVLSLSSYQPKKYTTCIPLPVTYIKHAVKSASMIFSATLLDVSSTTENYGPNYGSMKVNIYTFLPRKIWRGVGSDTIRLKSIPQDDLSFLTVGRKYLFITSSIWINQCDPIAEDFSNMDKELDKLSRKKRFKSFKDPIGNITSH